MPFPITQLVNVPQICHKGKCVLFCWFFSPLIALGSFRSQLYLPEGLSRALTGPFLVSSGLRWWWTSAFPPRKASSTRRQGKGGRWALAAKKETASEETQPSGTAGCRGEAGTAPSVAAPLPWGTEGAWPWPRLRKVSPSLRRPSPPRRPFSNFPHPVTPSSLTERAGLN